MSGQEEEQPLDPTEQETPDSVENEPVGHEPSAFDPSAVIKMVTPEGVPVELILHTSSRGTVVVALMDRSQALGKYYLDAGWTVEEKTSQLQAVQPSGPTFCGHKCSYTLDPQGFPSWIQPEGGSQAYKREKQGDVWWSTKSLDENGDEVWTQVFSIKKGERVPPVQGLPPINE